MTHLFEPQADLFSLEFYSFNKTIIEQIYLTPLHTTLANELLPYKRIVKWYIHSFNKSVHMSQNTPV